VRTITAVGVVLHPARDSAQALGAVVQWAARRGAEVVGLAEEIARLPDRVTCTDAVGLGQKVDLLVSLGGDGTMLRSLRLARAGRVPVLGVNLGRLGFLAEVDVPDLGDALCAIDEDRYTVETRVAVVLGAELVAAADDGDLAAATRTDAEPVVAFNDVALVRNPGQGVGHVAVHVEGHPFVRYAADAVVVATPTGSTAYSFSAGGPVVSPRAEGLLVVPVAPHSAFNRALFLSASEGLALEVLPRSGVLGVEVDGRLTGTVGPGDVIRLTAERDAGRVVRLGRTTFYERARRKLGLADPVELG